MKKLSLALLALSLTLLTLLPALAAEETPVTLTTETSGEVELIQCGSLSGPVTAPGQMSLLDADSEAIYQSIYAGLLQQAPTITLTRTVSCTPDTLDSMLDAFQNEVVAQYALVVNDNPRLFYVTEGYHVQSRASGYYSSMNFTATLTPSYRATFTQAEIQDFNDRADALVAQAQAYDTPLEQALFLHDYLVTHVTYNWAVATKNGSYSDNVFSAYGALVDGDAVCQGYALAYRLLLTELGINCTTISSKAMNHMWNAVELDGTWYHVDVTWDDPTPNVQGGGQHAYFLRGNTWMTETGKHTAWDDGQTACSDDDYQSDWWLNSVWFPIYRWNGSYYYIKMSKTPYEYAIYQTASLLEAGSRVTSDNLDNSYSSQNGVVWVDGQLYYTKSGGAGSRTLTRVDLATGQSAKVADIPFAETGSADGHYTASKDGIGLWYDPEQDLILATSNTRPGLSLGSFPVRSYPAEWDDLPTSTAAVRARWLGTSLQVGAVLPDSSTDVSLWAAFYDRDTGRLTALRQLDVSGAVNGLNVWELDDCGQLANCDTSLFLLDGGVLKPLCPSAAAQ